MTIGGTDQEEAQRTDLYANQELVTKTVVKEASQGNVVQNANRTRRRIRPCDKGLQRTRVSTI